VRFLVRAPAGATERISDESDDLRWWPLDDLPTDDDTLAELAAAAERRIMDERVRPSVRAAADQILAAARDRRR
jgi:hypothetical protein